MDRTTSGERGSKTKIAFVFSPEYEEMKKVLRKDFDDREGYFDVAVARTGKLIQRMLKGQTEEQQRENTVRLALAQMDLYMKLGIDNAILRLIAENAFSLTKALRTLSLTEEQVRVLSSEMADNRPTLKNLRVAIETRKNDLRNKEQYYKRLEKEAKKRGVFA